MQERRTAVWRGAEEPRASLERRVEGRTRELARAQRILGAASESISGGFSLYDNDDRLVLCNSRYRVLLYPGIEDVVVPGMSYETIIRRAAERGLIKDAETRIDAWVAERLQRHREPRGPHLQRRGELEVHPRAISVQLRHPLKQGQGVGVPMQRQKHLSAHQHDPQVIRGLLDQRC